MLNGAPSGFNEKRSRKPPGSGFSCSRLGTEIAFSRQPAESFGVLVLPFVAANPIVERIWLYEYLGRDVVADHAALEEAAGEEHEDAVVDKVLEGSKLGQTGEIRALSKEPETRPG